MSELTTTRFKKSIKSPSEGRVLKPGSNNKKLGFGITANKWRGKKLYSLTLTERDTCPKSCHHWENCYGNNMPFAHRFDTNGLEAKLRQEIDGLMAKHTKGIVVRLHVLGDFYSVGYVEFWASMLQRWPKRLAVFGYTAREPHTAIGKRIADVEQAYPDYWAIRQSRSKAYDGTRYAASEEFEGDCFICPEQTGKLDSCADCGLCWSVTKTVKFLTH